jgi:hypothetical protein
MNVGDRAWLPDGSQGTITLIDDRAGRRSATALGRADNGEPFAIPLAELELERELRLDEERIADEMEWEALRGITPPDY